MSPVIITSHLVYMQRHHEARAAIIATCCNK